MVQRAHVQANNSDHFVCSPEVLRDSKVRQMSSQWEHHANVNEERTRAQGLEEGLDSKSRYLQGKKGGVVMKISEFCSC